MNPVQEFGNIMKLIATISGEPNPMTLLKMLFQLQEIISAVESGNTAIPFSQRPEYLARLYKIYSQAASTILIFLEDFGCPKEQITAVKELLDFKTPHSAVEMRWDIDNKLNALHKLSETLDTDQRFSEYRKAIVKSRLEQAIRSGEKLQYKLPKETVH